LRSGSETVSKAGFIGGLLAASIKFRWNHLIAGLLVSTRGSGFRDILRGRSHSRLAFVHYQCADRATE
jgi:hypothetical protein